MALGNPKAGIDVKM
jgi:poly [ADP-ribose] polymerase 2/3/4